MERRPTFDVSDAPGCWPSSPALTTRPQHHEARVDAYGLETGYDAPALTTSVMLHVCRRNLRNGLEQDGTRRDAAGYRHLSIPSGYEVRV